MAFLKKNIGKFPSGKTKIIAIVSILLIIIISYGVFFYLQNKTENDIKNSLFEQQKQRQIESTKALSQHIGSDLDSIMTRLELLANSPILKQGDLSSNETRKLLQDQYNRINTLATADRLFILDKNNIATMSIIPIGEKQTFVGVDFSYRPWVKQTKTTLMPVFSEGFVGRDGMYRIALTYPITNGSGNYVGLVEALVPTIPFFQSYGNIYNIKAQYLAALDRNSVGLIHPVKSLIGKSFFGSYTQEATGHNKVLNNMINTVMSGKPDFAVYNFRNAERLNTGYPISVDGKLLYFIFVVTHTSTIYSQINNVVFTERVEMFSLLAGVTAAIAVLILFLLKWSSSLDNEVKNRTKELHEANEQLRAHDKMQKEFINMAAHELRTPIQAMLGLADLLKSKVNDKEQYQLAEVISRNVKRLKRLSQDALDLQGLKVSHLH